MDLGSFSFRWCVKPSFIMVCLLGVARYSYGDKNNCSCLQIPPVTLAEPPPTGCYNNTTFRYKCIDGYVRKAGTSNLIKCTKDGGKWSTPNLTCIPDPRRITTPSNIPVTAPSSTQPTTRSTTISASVVAETDYIEPTSPGLLVQSDYTQAEPVRTSTQPPKSTETTPSSTQQTTHSTTISASVVAETDYIEPTSPGLLVPSDYTQAASPTVHMTQSTTISASLAGEADLVEPTSPGLQVLSDHTQETRGMDQTSKPSILSDKDNSTSAYTSTTAAKTNVMSAVVAGVIIILLIGFGSFFYRRRRRKTLLHTSEEVVPMNAIESGLVST